MKEKLDSKSIRQIRNKLKTILKGLFEVVKITVSSLSKVLYLSVLMIVFDAMNYMRKYYSDDSFDNVAVDGNLRSFWKTEGKPHLTPLRTWELKDKYQIAKSVKISKEEATNILLASIPTFIVIMFVLGIRFADITFATVMYYNIRLFNYDKIINQILIIHTSFRCF